MAHTWGTLLDYVRTGQPAYRELFGRPFWEDLAAHPKIAADFDALMGPAGHGVPDFDIELTGGWGGLRTMVDVGGGTGAMLASLLRRHPHVRGILVDFPGTVARAGEILIAGGVADRVTLRGQSFFDPLPAGADLYLLKSVLNDWPDEQTVAILRRCARPPRPPGPQRPPGPPRPPSPPAGSPSSAESHPTTHPAPWASTCWSRGQDQYDHPVHRAGAASRPRDRRRRPQASGRYVVECRPASHTHQRLSSGRNDRG